MHSPLLFREERKAVIYWHQAMIDHHIQGGPRRLRPISGRAECIGRKADNGVANSLQIILIFTYRKDACDEPYE